MPSVIVVGGQWGDEGKGKIIDMLSAGAKHVFRAQGGNNAGHTVITNGIEYKLHLVPSGILHEQTLCYIGAGTVLDPSVLISEIEFLVEKKIQVQGRLWISPLAHVIFPFHRQIDQAMEEGKGQESIGTTARGIGPCYADKCNRIGIRMGEFIRPDLFPKLLKGFIPKKNQELVKLYDLPPVSAEELIHQLLPLSKFLRPFVTDLEDRIQEVLRNRENILFEGAQGTFLDLTFGTYPYVTSSNTTAAGICAGAGIGPTQIDHVLGVFKAYTTRVGKGPFPTEAEDLNTIIDPRAAREYGTTTGRRRRMGWFDAVLAKRAIQLNGIQTMAITKLDILDRCEEVKLCTGYKLKEKSTTSMPMVMEDLKEAIPIYESLPGWNTDTSKCTKIEELPETARDYLERLEEMCEVPISMISLGPEREKTIVIKDFFSDGI